MSLASGSAIYPSSIPGHPVLIGQLGICLVLVVLSLTDIGDPNCFLLVYDFCTLYIDNLS